MMAKIPKNPRSNCYFGCNAEGPLHHFPKPESDTERFEIWKSVLQNDIIQKGNMYIYNQLRLCNKHFEKYYLSPSNRLTRNAIPTLYINNDNISPSTSTQKNVDKETTVLINQTTKQSIKRRFVEDTPISSCVDMQPSTSANSSYMSVPLVVNYNKNTLRRKSRRGPTKQVNSVRVMERLKQRVLKLTLKCKTQKKKIHTAMKLSESKHFIKTIEAMLDTLKTFIKMQLKSKAKAKY